MATMLIIVASESEQVRGFNETQRSWHLNKSPELKPNLIRFFVFVHSGVCECVCVCVYLFSMLGML